MASDGPVVVAVDRFREAADAATLGRLLAAVTGAPLQLACVYPYVVHSGSFPDPSFQAELQREAAHALARAAEYAPEAERVPICDTSVGRALSEFADLHGASFLVIGPSHHAGLGRLLPGSTGERLLHGAPCPVALAPRGFATSSVGRLETVGSAFDGRPESTAALALAERLARTAGCRLEVIQVIEPVLTRALGATAEGDVVETLRSGLEQRLTGSNAASTVLLEGDPVEALAERSQQLDLLVCGSRGYGPLHAVMVGGVSGRLTRTAHCPLIVIPRSAEPDPRPAAATAAAAEA